MSQLRKQGNPLLCLGCEIELRNFLEELGHGLLKEVCEVMVVVEVASNGKKGLGDDH